MEFTAKPVHMANSLTTIGEQFLTSIRHALAAQTQAAYRTDAQQFVGYCLQRGISNIHWVSPQVVTDYLHTMIESNGCTPRTVARKLTSIRAYMKFAVDRDLIPANPCDSVRAPKVTIEPVIAPELDQLVRVIELIPQERPEDRRDRAFFMLLLTTALRPSGALSLDLYNPEMPPTHCIHPDGMVYYRVKGGGTETTLTTDETLEAIEQWLAVRHRFTRNTPSPALFIGRTGKRMSRQATLERLKTHGRRAGLPDVNQRVLRHARARQVIDQLGYDAAQALLCHKDRQTTVSTYGHHDKAKALAATATLGLPPAAEEQRSPKPRSGTPVFKATSVNTGAH